MQYLHLITIIFVCWQVDGTLNNTELYRDYKSPVRNNLPPPLLASRNYKNWRSSLPHKSDAQRESNTNHDINKRNRGNGGFLPPVMFSKSYRNWKSSQEPNKNPPFHVSKSTIQHPALHTPGEAISNIPSAESITNHYMNKRTGGSESSSKNHGFSSNVMLTKSYEDRKSSQEPNKTPPFRTSNNTIKPHVLRSPEEAKRSRSKITSRQSNANPHINKETGDRVSSKHDNNRVPPNAMLSKDNKNWKSSQEANRTTLFRTSNKTIKIPVLRSSEEANRSWIYVDSWQSNNNRHINEEDGDSESSKHNNNGVPTNVMLSKDYKNWISSQKANRTTFFRTSNKTIKIPEEDGDGESSKQNNNGFPPNIMLTTGYKDWKLSPSNKTSHFHTSNNTRRPIMNVDSRQSNTNHQKHQGTEGRELPNQNKEVPPNVMLSKNYRNWKSSQEPNKPLLFRASNNTIKPALRSPQEAKRSGINATSWQSNTNHHINKETGGIDSFKQNNGVPPNVMLPKSYKNWKSSQEPNKIPPFRASNNTIKPPVLPSSEESTSPDPAENEYYHDYIDSNQTEETTKKVKQFFKLYNLLKKWNGPIKSFVSENSRDQVKGPIEMFLPVETTTTRSIECEYVDCSGYDMESENLLPAEMERTEFFIFLEKIDNLREFKRNCCKNQPRDHDPWLSG